MEKMENLKNECVNIGRIFYTAMKDEWIESLGKVIEELDEFGVDED